jgi:hypothetical protein
MGRVLIKFNDNHVESFKCKNEKRAKEIYSKRPNAISFNYYDRNEYIPRPRPTPKTRQEMSIAEMEAIIARF